MKLCGCVAIICCSLVLFAACKKSEPINKSAKRQLLENGKWQMTASTATLNYMGKDTTMDRYAVMEACDKDDFITFLDNGEAVKDGNTNICAGNGQTETAQWVLLDNDTKIYIIDNNPDTLDLEITNVQLTLKMVKPNSSGTPVTFVDTYKNIR